MVLIGSVAIATEGEIVRFEAKKKYAKTQMKVKTTSTASAPNAKIAPLRFASLSSFLAVVILKTPITTKIKEMNTNTRKIRFTSVIKVFITSPGVAPKNLKIGFSAEPNARKAKSAPINKKMEQPNALMQPITNRLLVLVWSLVAGVAGLAAAGVATDTAGLAAAGVVETGAATTGFGVAAGVAASAEIGAADGAAAGAVGCAGGVCAFG